MSIRCLTSFLLAALALPAAAQTTWGLRSSVGMEKDLAKGLDAGLEFKYYQRDNFKSTDRWSVDLSLSKRLYRNDDKTFSIKASGAYKLLRVYTGWTTKYKGDNGLDDGLDPEFYITRNEDFNLNHAYSDLRHRVFLSVQAAYEIGRLRISWREGWQFTHSDTVTYTKDKYRFEGSALSDDAELAVKDGKSEWDKNMIRSRMTVDYDIRNWKYDPYVSLEFFNDMDDALRLDKTRVSAGVDFSFNKKHSFDVSYMWQDETGDDEPSGSYICLGYKYKF